MKKIISMIAGIALVAVSCTDMDLSPKDEAATGNWFKTPEQFEMCLNALLHHHYWPMERNEWTSGEQIELDLLTDDGTNRSSLSRYLTDGVDGSFPLSTTMWNISYKGINRCNRILQSLEKVKADIPEEKYNHIYGCAKFYRACFYGRIIIHFGDPVMVPEDLDLDSSEDRESAYLLSRSDRWQAADWVLSEFDEAAALLPVAYSPSEVERATKGAAYGMKARYALHYASIRKWDTFGLADPEEAERLFRIAADAAKAVMDLNAYTLHEDFRELFRMSTHHSPEGIFVLPRSKALSGEDKYQYLYKGATTAKLPRLSGANTCTTCCPSWDLLCAFYDDQGKPIDESSVYDPHNPFAHRDPRLANTIVEFGTEHVGVIYQPHFDVDKVWSYRENKEVTNNDSRTYLIAGTSNQYASYNGLVLRKHVDSDWLSPFEAENDKLILRYADILLMYAEAKIELGEIDASVLEAMNRVRARAYKADPSGDGYPKITVTGQDELRVVLRAERRMELAWENNRLYDLWRWRIAEKVLNFANYGIPAKNQKNQRRYIDDGMWFHGAVPEIDEDDCAHFAEPVASGNPDFFTSYAIKLSQRKFVAPKSYLWPIPMTTTDVMKNIKNNEGY
ncbi:MAG: RagB/SusD family nutrient uptake outer membrane protein [Candidatus Cryptobacteroides sp.]